MSEPESRPAIERELLEELTGGDDDLVRELLRLMREELPAHRTRIERAASGGSLEELARAVHALRGAAGNLGASSLRRACAAVEESARARRVQAAREELPTLLRELERLEAELRDMAAD